MRHAILLMTISAAVVVAIANSSSTRAADTQPVVANQREAALSGASEQDETRDPTRILLQRRDPDSWQPQEPYDLTGSLPAADDIRNAITKAVDWVLKQQRADGSWDVTLVGTVLSHLADEALDAIAVTSLAALALQPHAALDKRIEPALERAAQFVVQRVLRGKLSYSADYACWRYTLGLNFMMERIEVGGDDTKKSVYKTTARRCVNALLRMQLSNGERPLLDQHGRSRLATATGTTLRLPGKSGLVMALPTDSDFLGGALVNSVVEGSPAAVAGIKAGDRIVSADNLAVANAVDFYEFELDFQQGKAVVLEVKGDAGNAKKTLQLPVDWPVFTGIVPGGDAASAPTVEHFLRGAPAMKAGLEVGDQIVAIGGKAVASHSDFWEHQDALTIDKQVAIKIKRGNMTKQVTFKAEYAPAATIDIFGVAEDKSAGDGILVESYNFEVSEGAGRYIQELKRFPGFTALRLGIRVGDRITHLGDTPISGLDHWLQLSGTLPAGRPVTVTWVRDGATTTGTIVPDVLLARGFLDVGFVGANVGVTAREPRVMYVYKSGAAEKAGIKPGDVILSIGGRATPDRVAIGNALLYFSAGEEVEVGYRRGTTTHKTKLTLSYPSEVPVEEGGWAYYPSSGEASMHSTAAAMLALYDARDKLGFEIPRASLAAAERLLDSMRVTDPNDAAIESYMYRSGARNESLSSGIRRYWSEFQGNLGRTCICEFTLYRAKLRSKAHLERSVSLFVRNRHELDRVRDFWHTHHTKLWNNAAYYWMYGHHWAMVAAKEVGGQTFKTTNETVLKALMLDQEKDGTWLEHESFGKLCGTCQALWIFGQTEGDHRKP